MECAADHRGIAGHLILASQKIQGPRMWKPNWVYRLHQFLPQNIPEEICNLEEPRCRGWFYIDYSGFEQGPLKLGDLKKLVEDGLLQSDHLVK